MSGDTLSLGAGVNGTPRPGPIVPLPQPKEPPPEPEPKNVVVLPLKPSRREGLAALPSQRQKMRSIVRVLEHTDGQIDMAWRLVLKADPTQFTNYEITKALQLLTRMRRDLGTAEVSLDNELRRRLFLLLETGG